MKEGKVKSELNPEIRVSKGGKRIIHKDKYLMEIPYPKGKYKRLSKRITLGGA
tara:strand:+ start:707 stop:865 length:159 start_codon:yes stop_codon:yes gene_type:complete